MKGICRLFQASLLLCLFAATHAGQAAFPGVSEHHHFLEVEKRLAKGVLSALPRYSRLLREHPLLPYLQATHLRARVRSADSGEIVAFLNDHPDTPYGEHLRNAWLEQLAKRQQWKLFAAHYQEPRQHGIRKLSCLAASSLIHTREYTLASEAVRTLWLVASSQPEECDAPFVWGLRRGVIDQKMVWDRLVLIKRRGNARLAQQLSGNLAPSNRVWFQHLKEAHRHPEKVLASLGQSCRGSVFKGDVLAAAMSRLAKSEPEMAMGVWQKMGRARCHDHHQAGIALGYGLARQLYSREAYQVFASIPTQKRSERVYQEMIRIAIRTGQWARVLENLAELAPGKRERSEWQYWRAMALDATGAAKNAKAIFRTLAAGTGYFNFLAADHLRVPYRWAPAAGVSASILRKVATRDEVKRMRVFLDLDRTIDARRELRFLPDRLQESERRALSTLCQRWQWSYCAIRAMAVSPSDSEYYLRHPLPFKKSVRRAARESAVPVALLYAMMRTESAFLADAVSSAGARGLMQLLHPTARDSARLIGVKAPSKWRMLDVDLNIRLGAAHLAKLRRDFSESMVSVAAYNAGGRRVRIWLSSWPPRNPETWVSGLPFEETRAYVRRVFFSYLVTRRLLHEPDISLSSLMLRG